MYLLCGCNKPLAQLNTRARGRSNGPSKKQAEVPVVFGLFPTVLVRTTCSSAVVKCRGCYTKVFFRVHRAVTGVVPAANESQVFITCCLYAVSLGSISTRIPGFSCENCVLELQ